MTHVTGLVGILAAVSICHPLFIIKKEMHSFLTDFILEYGWRMHQPKDSNNKSNTKNESS